MFIGLPFLVCPLFIFFYFFFFLLPLFLLLLCVSDFIPPDNYLHSILIKFQPDATVCRYLFTAESLYMFRVSQHPSSGVLKTVTAASGTGHNTGAATSLQREKIGTVRVAVGRK